MAGHHLAKERVLQVTGQFLELAANLKERAAAERIQPALQQYRLGLFRLVVVGEIKKGKSPFINALLGAPGLLPTLSDVATSTVFKVEPEQWQQWRDRNLAIIAEHLQVPREKLIYFPVSSALKEVADSRHSPRHLERSGFIPLLHFLHHTLLKAKEERLARSLLQAAAREAAGIRRRLGEELQILRTESKAELDALEREFQEARAKFEQWRATDYQRVVGAFQDQSQDLKRATLDRLQNELDTSPTSSPLIGPIIAQLRQSDLSARQLNEQAAAVQSACIDASTRAIFDIQGDYNQRMQRLIAEASDQLGHTWRAEQSATVRGVSLPPVESLNMQFSGFEDARNALYGGWPGPRWPVLRPASSSPWPLRPSSWRGSSGSWSACSPPTIILKRGARRRRSPSSKPS